MTPVTVASGPALGRNRRRLLVVGLALGLLPAALDHSVFATALPTIAGELGEVSALFWVNTAYVLAATAVMPVYGVLGDRVGRRSAFLTALAIFLVGSVAGGLAGDLPVLVVARAIQGLGGGGLLVLIQAIVADVVPARERARSLVAVDAVFLVAALGGPVVGGWLAAGPGWRWAFWINLPIGAAALVAALLLVPASPRAAPSVGRNASEPLALLARRSTALPVVAGLLLGAAGFGSMTYLPTFLQLAGGLSPAGSGLMMLALVGGLGLATTAAAFLVQRTGRYRALPVAGAGLVIVGLLGLASSNPSEALPMVALYLFVLGAGIGCAWDILVLVVQNSAPPSRVGAATAANGFFREVGVLLGTALVGAMFAARLGPHLAGSDPGAATAALAPIFATLVPLVVAALVCSALTRSEPLAAAE